MVMVAMTDVQYHHLTPIMIAQVNLSEAIDPFQNVHRPYIGRLRMTK